MAETCTIRPGSLQAPFRRSMGCYARRGLAGERAVAHPRDVKETFQQLGRRERQIVDAVHALGEGGAREVADALQEPGALDSIRVTLGVLERKGVLRHRVEGRRHIYLPTQSPDAARRQAWKQLTRVFFGGSSSRALLALVDLSGDSMKQEELDALAALVAEKAQGRNGATRRRTPRAREDAS